jgi:hypothetical protein
MEKWVKDKNIKINHERGYWRLITGYNRILYEILFNNIIYRYVIETFNGDKLIITIEDLEHLCENLVIKSFHQGKIVNMQYISKNSMEIIDNKDTSFVSKKDYIPYRNGIIFKLIRESKIKEPVYPETINVSIEKTRMTRKELNSLQSKVSMAGIMNELVDLNTLALIKGNELYLYTMQKDVTRL